MSSRSKVATLLTLSVMSLQCIEVPVCAQASDKSPILQTAPVASTVKTDAVKVDTVKVDTVKVDAVKVDAVNTATATAPADNFGTTTTVQTTTIKTESAPNAISSAVTAGDAAAPLVNITPNMTLDAASLLPLSPSPLLQGEAQKADAQTEVTETSVQTAEDPAITTHDGIIVIDNDLEKENVVTEYVWKEIPDADGKIHIDAGGKFPVTVVTSHTSKTAKVGDPVEARLKVDIKIGGRMIAPKGSTVMGHIASCEKARKMIQAEFSTKRWMRPSGTLGVQFDEILKADGTHIPLVALPAQQARIIKNVAEGRVLGVNHKGEIVAPLSSQVKSQLGHLGIRAAASAAGPFSFGVVPVAYGVAGAISPSFAFMHPVGKNVRHRRLKGFTLGVVSGLPGGFILADSIIRGEEAVIKPGDEFLAEFQQKFTGEAATEAQMAPNAKAKVHGEVMPDSKKKK